MDFEIMEYIIPRILIDSFRANESIHPILPPFRPIARLERAPLLSSEGRIDRVENTEENIERKEFSRRQVLATKLPNSARLVEYRGSDVIAGSGDENCKMVHSIIELERFWLGQNPAVFFFQSFFFFSCSFVYRSRERITLGTVRFRERSRYE